MGDGRGYVSEGDQGRLDHHHHLSFQTYPHELHLYSRLNNGKCPEMSGTGIRDM